MLFWLFILIGFVFYKIMCGIFAVSGEGENAGEVVLGGLKKLEYRGYDSWGVFVRDSAGGGHLEKDVGKISEVEVSFSAGGEAMGHSRWATHGGVTKENAHPHQVGRVTLVHNGIFENYLDVKSGLSEHIFCSETDSEVFAALIDSFLEKGSEADEAIRSAAAKVDGRFAVVVMIDGVSGVFAARRGSPLIVGRGDSSTFIASDIPAFLAETNTVNYLNDGEMVFVRGTNVQFSDLATGEAKSKRNIEVSWKVEEAEKGAFEHFMIKEIFDQKETIARAVDQSFENLSAAVDLLKSSRGVYLIACGTAHKISMAGEYFFSEVSGRKINTVPASEMAYFERFVREGTVLMAISQSGETADSLEILERGKKKGARVLALTNTESSSMARFADVCLPLNAGLEKAVASTKAATSQMALLFLLAYADVGRIYEGRHVLLSAAGDVNELLNPRYEAHIRGVAERVVSCESLFIIGRGPLYPMALEAAIKIQEVSYINAQGFAAGELKHGPIALITDGVPCLVLGDDSQTLSNAAELKARGARIIGISPVRAEIFDEWIRVPDCDGAQAIASLVPVQILAYHLAVLRGLDPDMPRNLAKSVTVK